MFNFLVSLTFSMLLYTADNYRVNSGSSVTVDEHGQCRLVTNSTAKDYFVNTKTSAAWTSLINSSKTSLVLAPCVAEGYFVMTNTTWTGNLGGLSGADAKCLTELTTYDWMGKSSATITASNVKAFLCDSSTCNNPEGDTTYNFAVANSPSTGGDSFTTDSTGRGPGDNSAWNTSTTFSGGQWWSNRSDASASTTLWDLTPRGSGDCGGWTHGTGSPPWGSRGRTNITDEKRWEAGSNDCSNPLPLICMVHPDGSSGSGGGSSSGSGPWNELLIFEAPTSDGNLGGFSGAKATCEAQASSQGYSCSDINPFVSFDSDHEIRDLPTNAGYDTDVSISTYDGVKLADNWADLMDGSIQEDLFYFMNASEYHTGSNADGSLNADNCSGYTSTSGSGKIGRYTSSNSNWISYSFSRGCNATTRSFICMCNQQIANKLLLFRSTNTYNGNLGGASGAKSICESEATSQGHTCSNIYPFLSFDTNNEIRDLPTIASYPTDARVEHHDGTVIAQDWNDLLDGAIASGSSFRDIYGNGNYWTGSNADGSVNTDTCNGFTDSSSSTRGVLGFAAYDDSSAGYWLSYPSSKTCDDTYAHILCMCEK